MSLQIEQMIVLAAGACLAMLLLPRINQILRHTIVIVILANVIATVVIDYVPGDILHVGYLRVLIVLALLGAAVPLLRLDSVGVTIVGFLIFTGLLIPLSSNPVGSIDSYLKVFLALTMYILAFSLVRHSGHLREAYLGFTLGAAVVVVSFTIAQIFNLGEVAYGEGGAHTGGGGVHQTVLITYFILSLPLLYEVYRDNPRFRKVALAVALGGLIVLLLIFRRGSILALLAGLLLWAILTPQKKVALQGALGLGLVALILGPFLYDRLEGMYERRVVEGSQSYVEGEAGRMQDVNRAVEAFRTGGVTHALIGSEAFQDRAFFNTDRPIHVDYARILVGTGAIGLAWYLLIFFQVVRISLVRAMRAGTYQAKVGFAVVCGLVVASLIVSFSSQIYVVSSLSWFFLMLGAINGWFRDAGRVERSADETTAKAYPSNQYERVGGTVG
jgi:O-antigen ligase